MAQVDIAVFDKTGTLSKGGNPAVTDFEISLGTTSQWKAKMVLGVAVELESVTSHPLGAAIRTFCEARDILPLHGSTFEEVAGRGVKAYFEDMHSTAIIGNEAWLEEHGTVVDDITSQRLETWKSEAKSIVLLAIRDGSGDHEASASFVIAAIFAVADPLRPEAQSVVSSLQNQGISTWIISGDNTVTTRAVAHTVGIPMTNVIAGVLPHEKVLVMITIS
jgi:P-type E1-E2 ATPase